MPFDKEFNNRSIPTTPRADLFRSQAPAIATTLLPPQSQTKQIQKAPDRNIIFKDYSSLALVLSESQAICLVKPTANTESFKSYYILPSANVFSEAFKMVLIFTVVLQHNHEAELRFYHDGGALRGGTSHLPVPDGSGGWWYFICKSEGRNRFSVSGRDWESFARNRVGATVTLSMNEDGSYYVRVS